VIRKVAVAALAGVALAGAAAASPPPGELTVRVSNVRNAKGVVRIGLCPQAAFLKPDCPYEAAVPAHTGVTTLTLRGVVPGAYGLQVFHDENANHKVDKALFGLPKEGVGFSNDAPIRMAPPKWSDAVFAVAGGAQTIQVKMRYFL